MEKIKGWVRDNKNIAVLILVVILMFGLAFASNYIKQSNRGSVSTEESNGCVEGLCSGTEEPAATPSDNPSYSEALRTYTGKTIAIGENCEASPIALTTTVGTKILLANTSKTVVDVVPVTGKSVILRPYRYFTQTYKTPGTYPITCNGKNTATITVQ